MTTHERGGEEKEQIDFDCCSWGAYDSESELSCLLSLSDHQRLSEGTPSRASDAYRKDWEMISDSIMNLSTITFPSRVDTFSLVSLGLHLFSLSFSSLMSLGIVRWDWILRSDKASALDQDMVEGMRTNQLLLWELVEADWH